MSAELAVLVVEDEEIAARAHADYVGRVDGFVLSGVARTRQEAVRHLAAERVDVVLLDMNLPDGHGLDILRQLRGSGYACDVIAVTSARDLAVVTRAVEQGVASYLLKPFTFAAFRDKLERLAAFRRQVASSGDDLAQHEVDAMLGLLRNPRVGDGLPKGLTRPTLDAVSRAVREGGEPMSASEVAEAVGASRVTARRYLEHLVSTGSLTRGTRFGGSGRPEVDYRPA
ncbi:response regulator [Solicola sp. PLA-1-18]|uniref:response regulator n=1 Tax=Solicola sp. PLA-1-18 TaxID=3380532 RepID=UPI003B809FDB